MRNTKAELVNMVDDLEACKTQLQGDINRLIPQLLEIISGLEEEVKTLQDGGSESDAGEDIMDLSSESESEEESTASDDEFINDDASESDYGSSESDSDSESDDSDSSDSEILDYILASDDE